MDSFKCIIREKISTKRRTRKGEWGGRQETFVFLLFLLFLNNKCCKRKGEGSKRERREDFLKIRLRLSANTQDGSEVKNYNKKEKEMNV